MRQLFLEIKNKNRNFVIFVNQCFHKLNSSQTGLKSKILHRSSTQTFLELCRYRRSLKKGENPIILMFI